MRQFNPGRSAIGINGRLDRGKDLPAADQLRTMLGHLISKYPYRDTYRLENFRTHPKFGHLVVHLQEMDFKRIADLLRGHPVLMQSERTIEYTVLPNGDDVFLISPIRFERPIIDIELPEPA